MLFIELVRPRRFCRKSISYLLWCTRSPAAVNRTGMSSSFGSLPASTWPANLPGPRPQPDEVSVGFSGCRKIFVVGTRLSFGSSSPASSAGRRQAPWRGSRPSYGLTLLAPSQNWKAPQRQTSANPTGLRATRLLGRNLAIRFCCVCQLLCNLGAVQGDTLTVGQGTRVRAKCWLRR